jgi:outer membrane protein TolC
MTPTFDRCGSLLAFESYFHFDQPLGQVVSIRTGALGILPPGTVFKQVPILNQNAPFGTIFVAQPITKLIAVNAAVQLARADGATAQAQLDKGTVELLSGVAQAYHGLLGAQRIQAAVQLQVTMLEQLVKAKPDPRLQVALVEARQGLLQVNGQVEDIAGQLKGLLDLPPCTQLELVDPLPGPLPVTCADAAAQMALNNNPEVREAEQGVVKAQAALKVARMAYLPDVNVLGGSASQTSTPTIQSGFSYVGVTASWTLFEWGKKRDLVRQRETQIVMAQQNLAVTADKVQAEARKAYATFEQANEAYRLGGEMVKARKEVEREAKGEAALQAKADTSKAELEQMKAEIAYRIAHAKLATAIGQP